MRVLERTASDKEDIRHMSGAELSSLGIEVLDKKEVTLKCATCGHTWKPQLGADGKLPFDYWLCPSMCNDPKKAR